MSRNLLWQQSRPLTRRRVLGSSLGAGLGIASLSVLGACGDDDDSGDPTEEGATSAPSTASLPEEFVFANEAEPTDLMPFFAGFGQAISLRAVNESLIDIVMTSKADGSTSLDYRGRLAESWEQPDPKTFVVNLRKGVSFHDGEPWNAAAAVTGFDLFTDADLLSSLGKLTLAGRYIDSYEATDEYTITLHAKTAIVPQEFFGFTFYLGFSAFSPKAFADGGLDGFAEAPVGTGPYRLESWSRGGDLVLARFEDYWGDLPNMKRLKIITRPEASVRAQTVKAGEAHFAFNIGAEQAGALSNSVVGGGFQSNSLRINNVRTPTSDIRVRRAINYALDRDAINDAIFDGTATPIGFFAYQPVEVAVWPYDPAQARSLVDEAGIEGQELELVYGEGRIPEEDQLAEIFAAQLADVGFNIKLSKVERVQYNEVGALPFDQQPSLFMETTSSGNYGEMSGSLLDKYGCTGSGTFCDPAFDAEFQSLLALEGDERLELIGDIAKRLQEGETPRAWMLAVNQVHGLAENVRADLPLNVYLRTDDFGFA